MKKNIVIACILVLMLTLSSVAFVACDKDLDPFDIRQFYGDYHWVDYVRDGVICSGYEFEIHRIKKEGGMTHIVGGGDRYAPTITSDGIYYEDGGFREIKIDQNIVDAYNKNLADIGKNFRLTKDYLICLDSGRQFTYVEGIGDPLNPYNKYAKHLDATGHEYHKLTFRFEYEAFVPEEHPEWYEMCNEVVDVYLQQYIEGVDGETYLLYIIFKYAMKTS